MFVVLHALVEAVVSSFNETQMVEEELNVIVKFIFIVNIVFYDEWDELIAIIGNDVELLCH